MALPLLLILMLGVWEVGRMIQVQQILVNAAREGAGWPAAATSMALRSRDAMVQQACRDYMTSAGLPTAAVAEPRSR